MTLKEAWQAFKRGWNRGLDRRLPPRRQHLPGPVEDVERQLLIAKYEKHLEFVGQVRHRLIANGQEIDANFWHGQACLMEDVILDLKGGRGGA